MGRTGSSGKQKRHLEISIGRYVWLHLCIRIVLMRFGAQRLIHTATTFVGEHKKSQTQYTSESKDKALRLPSEGRRICLYPAGLC